MLRGNFSFCLLAFPDKYTSHFFDIFFLSSTAIGYTHIWYIVKY